MTTNFTKLKVAFSVLVFLFVIYSVFLDLRRILYNYHKIGSNELFILLL